MSMEGNDLDVIAAVANGAVVENSFVKIDTTATGQEIKV